MKERLCAFLWILSNLQVTNPINLIYIFYCRALYGNNRMLLFDFFLAIDNRLYDFDNLESKASIALSISGRH